MLAGQLVAEGRKGGKSLSEIRNSVGVGESGERRDKVLAGRTDQGRTDGWV